MGKVVLDMSMSLDGFIAGTHGEDGGLYDWYFAPAEDTNGNNQRIIEETIQTTGAILMGRRAYDVGDQQDGFADNPYDVPHFVLTHHVPDKPTKGATAFTFVTDGIESAVRQAKAAAGDKDVAVGGGADIAQQCLKAELIDEIQIHVVPVFLSTGIRLFDHLSAVQIELESTRVVESPNVTHLKFRVVK